MTSSTSDIPVFKKNGWVCAKVPAETLWNLVEYLSWQRVSVSYSYDDDHFTVYFPNSDEAAVQKLLTDWMHSEMATA